MGQRIRQLEDALAIFQSGVSTESHPLLRDELLAIKFGPEVRQSDEPEPPPVDAVTESMDALGTLTIGASGEATYFGRSAGSEVCYRFSFMELLTDQYFGTRLFYWYGAPGNNCVPF